MRTKAQKCQFLRTAKTAPCSRPAAMLVKDRIKETALLRSMSKNPWKRRERKA